MTIKQKAREIAFEAKRKWLAEIDMSDDDPTSIAARLGIIEGVKMAAKVAQQWDENSPHNSRAAAILALIEEQKL